MNHDRLVRMAYAIIWADRRAGETPEDAAKRAAEATGECAERVLHLSCVERSRRFNIPVTDAYRELGLTENG